MADAVDMATEIEAELVALGIAGARVAVPKGAAGECSQCEWWMPRLVDGRCGYCRDGRSRPPDWEPPEPPTLTNVEIIHMPGKTISLPAAAAIAIEAVEKRAKVLGDSLGVAAADLIVAGAQTMDTEAEPPVALDVAALSFDELLAELAARVQGAASPAAIDALSARADAAEARAVAAETKLAHLREALAA